MLFPVWHQITVEEIWAYRAWLANIIGRRTDMYTIDEIADEIYEEIHANYAHQQASETDVL